VAGERECVRCMYRYSELNRVLSEWLIRVAEQADGDQLQVICQHSHGGGHLLLIMLRRNWAGDCLLPHHAHLYSLRYYAGGGPVMSVAYIRIIVPIR